VHRRHACPNEGDRFGNALAVAWLRLGAVERDHDLLLRVHLDRLSEDAMGSVHAVVQIRQGLGADGEGPPLIPVAHQVILARRGAHGPWHSNAKKAARGHG
jgi:hypothetical protein